MNDAKLKAEAIKVLSPEDLRQLELAAIRRKLRNRKRLLRCPTTS